LNVWKNNFKPHLFLFKSLFDTNGFYFWKYGDLNIGFLKLHLKIPSNRSVISYLREKISWRNWSLIALKMDLMLICTFSLLLKVLWRASVQILFPVDVKFRFPKMDMRTCNIFWGEFSVYKKKNDPDFWEIYFNNMSCDLCVFYSKCTSFTAQNLKFYLGL
jgi:hypothetical protein